MNLTLSAHQSFVRGILFAFVAAVYTDLRLGLSHYNLTVLEALCNNESQYVWCKLTESQLYPPLLSAGTSSI